MRKLFLCLPCFVLVVACSPPPTNKSEVANSSSAVPTNSAEPAAESDSQIIARERSVWEAIKNKEFRTFENFLAPDQMEVGEEGVTDKNGTMESVRALELADVTFSEWRVLRLNPNLVVTTYRVAVKGKQGGKDFPPADVRASSAWVNRDGKWQAIFHQSTSVAKTPPPTPAESPARTASPAAGTQTGLTGTDPIANEKSVWEMFKTKNYDGFANVLEEKVIEVNDSGVYDKAGIVQGVQGFDATKVETSDFKALNMDKNAALVTYTARVPGPKPMVERHSTIWVNRDGKWLVAFHQGTPATEQK